MDAALLLFVLRVLSALVLLGFFGSVAWLIYRDVRVTTGGLATTRPRLGYLKVISDSNGTSESEGEPVRYPLLPVTSIGRAMSNTIVLNDNYISNEHALLTLRGQQWWLEDLNSRNGTLLNGVRVSEAMVVSPGDVIGLGDIRLKLEPDMTDGDV